MVDRILTPCNVACGSGIMTVNSPSGSRPTLQRDTCLWDGMSLNSPGGSTLQCGSWLWDDMPLNSPNVCHIGILLLVSISAISLQSTCHSAPVCEIFIQIGPPSSEKNGVMSISAILDFRGPIMHSLKSPCTTSYRSLIETLALNCLVFEIITFSYFGVMQTNKQTDKQTGRQTDRQTKRWTASMH